ncbi:hypothetical protein GJ496_008613 [Pomphorhynchus laevis]|nr:hypothetical protein GJ496_008613 [Pomphorhynchus laevis]
MASKCLSDEERFRYSRQTAHYDFNEDDQVRLKCSSVLIVGCGGLGSIVSMQLAASGIGHLGLIDGDTVEISNLHRQLIHDETSVGVNKAISAERRLVSMNTNIAIFTYTTFLDADTFLLLVNEELRKFDVIVNCTDSFEGADQCNRLSVLMGVPLISASVVETHGELANYNYPAGIGSCYECVHRSPGLDLRSKRSAAQFGVFAPVVGIVASAQALEVMKVLLGKSIAGHTALKSEMALFDCSALSIRKIKLKQEKRADCKVCSVLKS